MDDFRGKGVQGMRESDIEFINESMYPLEDWEQKGGVWLVKAGKSSVKPNYFVGPRTAPFYCLHFILEGHLRFKQGDVEKTLSSNDLFCLFPGMTHQYSIADPTQPLKLAWIGFNGLQAADLLRQVGITPGKPYAEKRFCDTLQRLFNSIYRKVTVNKSEGMDMIVLLYTLFQKLQTQEPESDKIQDPYDLVYKSKEYMNLYFPEGIQVMDIIHRFGVSRSYYAKMFNKYLGCRPKDYLHQLRMKTGQSMLENTEKNVTDIALAVGYSDVYYFSRAFKKYFGISPLKYRDKCKS
ncbi:AraC family transcriptional regulator [Paenibacillus sp. J5C_2022]|uniref:AraC family transcriptional regulator n=1 Tax=Paenibacillus sp. J5C2022 TaxID=2977129 RepID=UPI0021CF6C73|nr:AraC family transcriptional regulator [Paenibacillus sp. J5C2022]MCU6710199.1 AraC family transcriptional regulator [Paenibacillus sp. J5C2022]